MDVEPVDPDLKREVCLAIDSSLIDLYVNWSETYDNLQVNSEEEFLDILYMFFRLAYSMGVNDGVHMQEDDEYVIPVFDVM